MDDELFSYMWVTRVPSHSNPADHPSRGSIKEISYLQPMKRCEPCCPLTCKALEVICWSRKGRRMMHNAVQWQWYAMRKWWHAICETSCKAATLNNSQPMPNLSFSPVNARRKRKARFRCSALHFTHVVCKNQPNKLFEVMVRCATYPGDVWIYHTNMNTHMLYHFMPEDMPGIMWFCSGSLKP